MPTKNPRVNLVFGDHDLYELVDELAKIEGKSRAAVIMDVLDATAPSLLFLLETLRKAQSVPEQLRAAVLASIDAHAAGMREADAKSVEHFQAIGAAVSAATNDAGPELPWYDDATVHLGEKIGRGAGSHDG